MAREGIKDEGEREREWNLKDSEEDAEPGQP